MAGPSALGCARDGGRGEERGQIPKPKSAPHLPTPGQCWAQSVSASDLGLTRGKHLGPKVATLTPGAPGFHALALPALPVGTGPQAKRKGAGWRQDLVSPIPQGPSPAAAQLPPQAGPTSPTPTSQVDAHTAPKPGPARLCRAHPHAHAHTGTPPPPTPVYLPREKAGGQWAGQGLLLLPPTPHPPPWKAMGPLLPP